MSLLDNWNNLTETVEKQGNSTAFWAEYFDMEKDNYVQILTEKKIYKDTFDNLAAHFNMNQDLFIGFLSGINTSLKKDLELEAIENTSEVELDIDYEKLYFNMLDARAKWLYTLPEWEDILSSEKRKEITKTYRATVIAISNKVGRNDPCPCGSGKKYKNCCEE